MQAQVPPVWQPQRHAVEQQRVRCGVSSVVVGASPAVTVVI
ncbi:hypothetical protein Ae406Ps2_6488 [Pseudonocardia sp. Ae406_Ps2]|nr:hypothetical protein Ae406Ps2_6488 [Pseudonocardia sp. Ae406_Ps2]